MRIETVTSTAGIWGVQVTPDPVDSVPPVSCCAVDASPRIQRPERLLVGSFLVFGRYAVAQFESLVYVDPLVRERISLDLGVTKPHGGHIPSVAASNRTLHVVDNLAELQDSELGLAVLKSDSWHGALRTHQHVAVGSNAFLMGRFPLDPVPLLGVATWFADDLGAGVLRLSPQLQQRLTTEDAERVAPLLRSCGLELHWNS